MNKKDLKPVSQEVYTKEYYLKCRQGSDEFSRSGGKELSAIHSRILELAQPEKGRRIFDIGCGCGELVIHAALRGAEAVGIDYSESAHQLAVESAERLGAAHHGASAKFILGDVSNLPNEKFDAVILADIVEHLTDLQLQKLYIDIKMRLKPGGRLIIHTWPNRWHTHFSYPLARIILSFIGIKKPKSPRKPHDEIMHINEQSVFSLKHDLKMTGFLSKVWVEHIIPDSASAVYKFVHLAPVFKLFFADHIFAIAEPK